MSDDKHIGNILAVCISEKKHTPKKNMGEGKLQAFWGLVGDAHAGEAIKQVSLLSNESIKKVKKAGLNVSFGDFGENFVTEGIDLSLLRIGQRLRIGIDIFIEVSQIGKQCVKPCAIFYKMGNCIMPKEGIFAKVLRGGTVKTGDSIETILGTECFVDGLHDS